MKSSIINLSSVNNPESFTKLIESIQNNRKNIEQFIKSYSKEIDFDEIDENYKENLELIEEYRELSENHELLLLDILEVLKKHNEKFCKNSNLKKIAKKLDITFQMHDEIEENDDLLDFYAKIQEDSHILIIFNFKTKKFTQIKTDFFFPSKTSSYFIRSSHDKTKYNFSIFLSGGLIKNKEYQSDLINNELNIDQIKKLKYISLNDFYEIKITFETFEDVYKYHICKLENMNVGRYSHSMVMNKDFLFAISGQNTKTCEIYNIKSNKWKLIPEIPSLCLNSSLVIVDNHLFCISGSSTLNSFDAIYKISLNNIDRFFNDEKGFEDFLVWEQIDYYFSSKNFYLKKSIPRLRRGMATLYLGGNSIFLFGGFDHDNIYDDIFEVIFKNKTDKDLLENTAENTNNEKDNSEILTYAKNNNNTAKEQINKKTISNTLYKHEEPLKNKNNLNEGINFNDKTKGKIKNSNIFDKSEKAIEDEYITNQIVFTNPNKEEEEERENGNYIDYCNGKNDNLENSKADENEYLNEGLKIEKKLTTLPNKTFFSTNPIILGNTILMVDGFNNTIEYDIVNNHFYYYT